MKERVHNMVVRMFLVWVVVNGIESEVWVSESLIKSELSILPLVRDVFCATGLSAGTNRSLSNCDTNFCRDDLIDLAARTFNSTATVFKNHACWFTFLMYNTSFESSSPSSTNGSNRQWFCIKSVFVLKYLLTGPPISGWADKIKRRWYMSSVSLGVKPVNLLSVSINPLLRTSMTECKHVFGNPPTPMVYIFHASIRTNNMKSQWNPGSSTWPIYPILSTIWIFLQNSKPSI